MLVFKLDYMVNSFFEGLDESCGESKGCISGESAREAESGNNFFILEILELSATMYNPDSSHPDQT